MSSIGFDGKLEPAFFQHILIGRVEHQPFQCGMDELEPMYAYVMLLRAMLHVMLHGMLHVVHHLLHVSCLWVMLDVLLSV